MASLPAGPYIFSTSYLVDGLRHDLELNCDTLGTSTPGVSPDDLLMAARSEAAEVTLAEAANEFWAVYRTLLTTTSSASTYTLWKANTTNTKRQFISGGSFTNPTGTATGAYVPAQQLTMTFRSATGRLGRLICLETNQVGNDVFSLNPAGESTFDVIAAYMIGPTSIFTARDSSYFVQALNGSLGQNEEVWRNRFRI